MGGGRLLPDTVAMVVAMASLICLPWSLGQAASITLSWSAPHTNVDGTPLTDLAGYQLYYGTASGQYDVVIDVGNQTTVVVSGLADDRVYYFSVTAYDKSLSQ